MASISTTIFDELLTTIEKIGVDRTVKILQEAKLQSVLLNDINIEFVLNTVSEVTSVSRDTILNGVIRNDERKIAIQLRNGIPLLQQAIVVDLRQKIINTLRTKYL